MNKTQRNLQRAASGLAGVLMACMAVPALAEKPDLVPRENYQRPAPHPTSVPERAPESMEPQGGRVGSFIILPSAELTGAFDSNVFATPNNSHAGIIEACLEAGKPFLGEKPFSRLFEEAVALKERYERRPVPAMIGFSSPAAAMGMATTL